jgi:hypothetical protein
VTTIPSTLSINKTETYQLDKEALCRLLGIEIGENDEIALHADPFLRITIRRVQKVADWRPGLARRDRVCRCPGRGSGSVATECDGTC